MTDDRFWQMIEDARGSSDFYTSLAGTLKGLPPDDIVAFENTLRQKLATTYTFPLLMANFVIQSYVSDDVFQGFRAWLVTQGRERFESALANPELICDWLDRGDVDAIDGETMLLIAQTAYKQYDGENEFADHITYPAEPTISQDWPDDKAGFREQYPQLVDKFWDQERIRELHSD